MRIGSVVLAMAMALAGCGKKSAQGDRQGQPQGQPDSGRIAASVWVDGSAAGADGDGGYAMEQPKTAEKRCMSKAACDAECKAGVGEACHRLGLLLLPSKADEAAALGIQACDLGYPLACPKLAVPGDGTSADRVRRRRELLSSGCAIGGAGYCTQLGDDLRGPLIGKPSSQLTEGERGDLSRAEVLFEKSCDLGDVEGCRLLVVGETRAFSAHASDVSYQIAAVARLRKLEVAGCAGGDAEVCAQLAEELATERAPNAAEIASRAVTLFRSECDAGWMPSCGRACTLGHKPSCSRKP